MGTTSGIAGALFAPVQQRVLALLFGQPDRQFRSAEVIDLIGSGTGAVHRQLIRLEEAGLINATRSGNQKHYQANHDSPVFTELHGLVVKTVGLAGPLKEALAPLAPRIHTAFVYGSVAKGSDRSQSDVDVFVVSDQLSYAEVFEALQPVERRLARTVNPVLMTRAAWRRKRSVRGSFVQKVGAGPLIHLIGTPDGGQ